jgi:transcription initiation factor TFIIIB Brf1 subunit/transcription initiation factor TFIIB
VVLDTVGGKAMRMEHHKLMARANPAEERERLRMKTFEAMCDKIGASSLVKDRAMLIYNNHKVELNKLKPRKKMLLGCVMVASRSTRSHFIPMSYVKCILHEESEGLGRYCRDICKIVGLNQKTFTTKAVPYIVSNLRLPFKFEKVLIDYYDRVSVIAPEVAPETRMGIAACRILKEEGLDTKIKRSYVAYVCGTAETSIRTFLDKNRKRRRE